MGFHCFCCLQFSWWPAGADERQLQPVWLTSSRTTWGCCSVPFDAGALHTNWYGASTRVFVIPTCFCVLLAPVFSVEQTLDQPEYLLSFQIGPNIKEPVATCLPLLTYHSKRPTYAFSVWTNPKDNVRVIFQSCFGPTLFTHDSPLQVLPWVTCTHSSHITCK